MWWQGAQKLRNDRQGGAAAPLPPPSVSPLPQHTTILMPYTLTELQQLNYDVIIYVLRNDCPCNFIKNFVWKLCSIEKQVQAWAQFCYNMWGTAWCKTNIVIGPMRKWNYVNTESKLVFRSVFKATLITLSFIPSNDSEIYKLYFVFGYGVADTYGLYMNEK